MLLIFRYKEEKVTGLLRVDRAVYQTVTVMVPEENKKKSEEKSEHSGSSTEKQETPKEIMVEQVFYGSVVWLFCTFLPFLPIVLSFVKSTY